MRKQRHGKCDFIYVSLILQLSVASVLTFSIISLTGCINQNNPRSNTLPHVQNSSPKAVDTKQPSDKNQEQEKQEFLSKLTLLATAQNFAPTTILSIASGNWESEQISPDNSYLRHTLTKNNGLLVFQLDEPLKLRSSASNKAGDILIRLDRSLFCIGWNDLTVVFGFEPKTERLSVHFTGDIFCPVYTFSWGKIVAYFDGKEPSCAKRIDLIAP